jgi:hypothetical protein
MGGDQVSGHFYLESKYRLSYQEISPRWLQFDVLLDECILLNQRNFFSFNLLELRVNRRIGERAEAAFIDVYAGGKDQVGKRRHAMIPYVNSGSSHHSALLRQP